MGQIIEQNVYNYHQRRLLMKAVILNASGWIIVPLIDALAKYLSNSMYSHKEMIDDIPSTTVVSTLMSLITIPKNFFLVIKYFNSTNIGEFIIKKSLNLKSKNRFIWEK